MSAATAGWGRSSADVLTLAVRGLAPGGAVLMTTYRSDGRQVATGEPFLEARTGAAEPDELLEEVWAALAPEFRVAMTVFEPGRLASAAVPPGAAPRVCPPAWRVGDPGLEARDATVPEPDVAAGGPDGVPGVQSPFTPGRPACRVSAGDHLAPSFTGFGHRGPSPATSCPRSRSRCARLRGVRGEGAAGYERCAAVPVGSRGLGPLGAR